MTNKLREHYRQMPLERLLHIAVLEADGLTPEALQVLNAELEARGIDRSVEKAVVAQTQPLSRTEIEALVTAIRRLPCPRCGRNDRLLNGGEIAVARSFVVFTTYDCEMTIACPDCLVDQARKAKRVTALLGWWGIPSGPIRAIQAISCNEMTILKSDRKEASDVLTRWVESNPGLATTMIKTE